MRKDWPMSPAPREGFDPEKRAPWERGARLKSTPATAVTPTKPEWIVNHWILARGLNLIIGRQGGGKTTFACYVTSCLTTEKTFPGDEARDPMRVAILSLEEPDDRVVARLSAAGADLERVHLLGDVEDVDDEGRVFWRRWQLPKDISVLGEAITDLEIDVVIVDGLGYSISGDSHNYAVVGSALAALSGEAERTGAAIVGLVHPPKGSSDPVTAAIGSTAWTAIPRVCVVLGVHPEDETKRVARVAKSNYKMPEAGIAFTIAGDERFECGYVDNVRDCNISAEEITAAPVTSEERTERTTAREFLRELLADDPMPSEDVQKAAERVGISKRTLTRARGDVGVVSTRRNDPHTGRMMGWILALPSQKASAPTSAPEPESWRSGRTGHTQGKSSISVPERQLREAGALGAPVDPEPFYSRNEF
jgi:putative DNA primase/helicase